MKQKWVIDVIKEKIFYCNTELALDVIGGKWKPLILYHLDFNETIRFGEFKRLIPNVSESVLSRQLKELERDRLIIRDEYMENVPRVEYSLSQEGKRLSPIIVQLGEWGKSYNMNYQYGQLHFNNNYEDEKC